ncbi:MAG: response regulator [Gammaproteobacteria bacterium]
MNKITAFIIDDSDIDRYIAGRVLNRSEAVGGVEEVSDGVEGLDMLSNRDEFTKRFSPIPPRPLIFLDINMPGMNGFEMLAGIQKLKDDGLVDPQQDFVVVMLTSSADRQDREKSLAYDFVTEYVEKPLSVEKLHSLISTTYQEVKLPT